MFDVPISVRLTVVFVGLGSKLEQEALREKRKQNSSRKLFRQFQKILKDSMLFQEHFEASRYCGKLLKFL